VADPSLIGQDRTLPLSSVVDARLVYNTFLSAGPPVIGAGDVEDKIAASATETAAAQSTTPVLTDRKRRELLLIYLNRLIDLVFE